MFMIKKGLFENLGLGSLYTSDYAEKKAVKVGMAILAVAGTGKMPVLRFPADLLQHLPKACQGDRRLAVA